MPPIYNIHTPNVKFKVFKTGSTSSATFAMPEVKIATIPGWGGTERLPKIIGLARAKAMILTGTSIDANTALNWGLVTQVCPPDQLPDVGAELAATICSNAPVAVQLAKQMLHAECSPLESVAGTMSAFTADGQEGTNSFLQRRPPEYKGS